MKICNGCSLIQSHSRVLVKTNESRKRWDINRGKWSKEEQLLHIDFENNKKFLIVVHFQIDSTTALLYLVKMGGNREPNVTEIKEINLALSLQTPDHNYCRKPSKFFECGGRLAFSKRQRPIRMEPLPQSISTSLPEERSTQSRFVCIKAVSLTTPVL